eukprot:Em0001g2194a
MRDKMEMMTKVVHENLKEAQRKQKAWYDQNARERTLQEGDLVLVLLPTSSNKLAAKWQGPYKVERRVGKVNYVVDMHDRRKRRRIFHINMLREFHSGSGPSAVLWTEGGEEETDSLEDIPVWRDNEEGSLEAEAVADFPRPRTKTQVREFLGLTGYYRRFIPNYATLATPLTDLTKKSAPTQVQWTDKCGHAFGKLKERLCSDPVLGSPDFTRPFILQTDASERGVGAVLSQRSAEQGEEHPIAFFSRKLLPREEKYSTIEKECLAIKLAMHSGNRPSFPSVAGQAEGQQLAPNTVELGVTAI